MRALILIVGLGLMLVSCGMALTVASVEPIQRSIIYIHVPASICAIACFIVLFVCSIKYLQSKNPRWDFVSEASAEAGLVFATVLNLTGMIFAYAEWNVWWTPSPRLISSAVLWFLYAAYLILRTSFSSQQRKEQISAVFGIIAFLDVPLVLISARFIRDIHRPAFSFDTAWQNATFTVAIFGTALFAAALIWIRKDVLKIKHSLKSHGPHHNITEPSK